MSDERFDDVTRALGNPMPRRRALLLLGAAVGATVLGLRPTSAQAACSGGCYSNSDCEKGCGCNDSGQCVARERQKSCGGPCGPGSSSSYDCGNDCPCTNGICKKKK